MSHMFHLPGHELLVPDIVSAEACHLVDDQGKRYLDLESGVWCASIGHSHRRILAVMQDQASRVLHAGFNYSSSIVEGAAAEVLALLGFEGGKCVFLSSGSEAVEYGLRLMRQVQGRPRILTMAESYFGAYGSAASRKGADWWGHAWLGACDACPFVGDCSDECGLWEGIPHAELGGLLFEPGSSAGLVRFPPNKLIRALADEIHRQQGLVMVNEVTTGIGRTGRWFGFQHYDLEPDIVVMGKGLGAGYPVSCVAVNAEVAGRMGGRTLAFAQSHQNDPLGAAIAREVIGVIRDEDLVAQAEIKGAELSTRLRGIADRCDGIAAVRGRGLMQLIAMKDDPDDEYTTRVHRDLAEQGFLVGRRSGHASLRLDPPLTIEPAELNRFLETFETCLPTGSPS